MEKQNPWWQSKPSEIYQKFTLKPLQWIPPLLSQITLTPYSLHFLTGPRQVGKTTLLHLLIHKQQQNRDPFSIFYYQCDLVLDYKELNTILENYLSSRTARRVTSSLIILDEITYVKEWKRTIKFHIDQGSFANDVVIISGSTSMELLKDKESFPGRRGKGQDYELFPLNFPEYCRLFGINLQLTSLENITSLEAIIAPNRIFQSEINRLFQNYLITGGFPLLIIDFHTKNLIEYETKRTYLDWIRGDTQKVRKTEEFMREIITTILKTRGSTTNWLAISKETSIHSPHTVEDYIDTLKQIYVLRILYQINAKNQILYRKNKKIHIWDPGLARILAEYLHCEILEEQLVESTVAIHFNYRYPTYFAHEKYEVDILSIINEEQIGFEVKWGPKSWKKPLFLKKAFLITKEILPLFLASVNWNQKNA